MGPGEHPLVQAVAHLEILILRLEAGNPVKPLVDAFLEQQLRLLTFPVQEDVTEVRRLLARLKEDPSSRHLPDLKAAVDAARVAAVEGPTRSPRANALLGMALAACQDPDLDFSREAAGFLADLDLVEARVSASAEGAASCLVREEARRLTGVAEAARTAMVELEAAVAGGLEEDVRTAGEAFVEAVRGLGEIQGALAELADREGRTPCVRCGHFNAGDRSTCERCAAVLPADATSRESEFDVRVGEDRPAETRMTENLARLFAACDRYEQGTLDADGFLEEVAWLEGILDQARRMGLGDSAQAREGAEEFTEGLATLRQAAESGEPALVVPGRRLVWDGAGKLQAG